MKAEIYAVGKPHQISAILKIMVIMIMFTTIPKLLYCLSISEIVAKCSPGIVQIVAYDITGELIGQGSGFFITSKQILTCAHVVKAAYSAEVYSSARYYNILTVTKSAENVDLAIIEVDSDNNAILTLAQYSILEPGQRVIAIGSPLGLEKTVSDGIISAIRLIDEKMQIIQFTAPVSPGSSGCPLLDINGEVIGVTSATISEGQNINFAVGPITIADFLFTANNPRHLHPAKSKVLFRVVFKWIGRILLGIIALAFGGGWYILAIAIVIIAGIFYGIKYFVNFIIRIFRRKLPSVYATSNAEFDTKPGSPETEINAKTHVIRIGFGRSWIFVLAILVTASLVLSILNLISIIGVKKQIRGFPILALQIDSLSSRLRKAEIDLIIQEYSKEKMVDLSTSDIQDIGNGFSVCKISLEQHLSGVKIRGTIINGTSLNHTMVKFKITVSGQVQYFTVNRINAGSSGKFTVYIPDIPASDTRWGKIEYDHSTIWFY